MRQGFIPVLLWSAAALMLACSSGGDNNTPDVAADGTSQDSMPSDQRSQGDLVPDIEPDQQQDSQPADALDTVDTPDSLDVSPDLGDGADVGSDVEVVLDPLPIEPPAIPASWAMIDPLYEQEFNHTWNENEPEVGELIALIDPPQGYDTWETPTLVSPDGILLRDHTGVLMAQPLPNGDSGPIVSATATELGVYVATSTDVYKVEPGGTHTALPALPSGVYVTRLVGTGDQLHILGEDCWVIYWIDSYFPQTLNGDGVVPRALARNGQDYYVASDYSLALMTAVGASFTTQWSVPLDVGTPVAVLRNRTLPQSLQTLVVGTGGMAGFGAAGDEPSHIASVPLFESGTQPLAPARGAVSMPDGGFAVFAQGGVYRLVKRDGVLEYRVYAPERWMPTGDVRDILAPYNAEGSLYFATSGGLGFVTTTTWRVADKARAMVDRIVQRHDRDGAVADSHLTVPGDLSTNIPWDSDNDGGWSCYWVLSECFRYKVTGAADAKAHFDKSLDRMLSLRTLTGTDYFLARSVIRIEGCQLDDCDNPDDGEWFKSPDGEWWVKGNTSNDEVTSHMFMMGMAYDLCADDSQKEAIRAHIDGIVGGLVDNGYRLVDPQDGQPTSYGQFDPQYVNWWVEGQWGDGGRRSAQILGALNLAHYLTGKQKYLDAKAYLMGEQHYAENIDKVGDAAIYPFCAGNGDCDELGMQAFYALIRYEPNPLLRARWQKAWQQLYQSLHTQQDALWELSNVFLGGSTPDLSLALRWFHNYPTDLIRFVMRNESRIDAVAAPAYYLTKDKKAAYVMRSDGQIFPGDERPNDRHNTNQFVLNGGLGAGIEMDSADVLFAYWMGRYYGYVQAP